jgi:hypothetical protein
MFGMKPLHRTYVYRAVLIMANGGVSTVWVRGGGPFHVLTTCSTAWERCPFSGGLSVDGQIIGYLVHAHGMQRFVLVEYSRPRKSNPNLERYDSLGRMSERRG